MKMKSPAIVLFTMLLLNPCIFGGDWLHSHRHGDTPCDCHGHGSAGTTYFHSAYSPAAISPAVNAAWGYTSAASACCGGTMGVPHIASHPAWHSWHEQSGPVYWRGMRSVAHHGLFLSGFEGIPSMDGGGIHHRYPYHSYRRPWAHPGTPSTNVTIIW
jgi:hypothetical protein